MSLWFPIAVACGLVPLVVGSLAFLAWLATGADWLMVAGVATAAAGLVAFGIVLVAVLASARRFARRGTPYDWRLAAILGLLVLKIPIVFAMVGYAWYRVTSYEVLVVNNSAAALREITFVDPAGRRHTVPMLPPFSREERRYRFDGEGAVAYRFDGAAAPSAGTLIGYVTGGSGGSVRLEVAADGSVAVSEGGE